MALITNDQMRVLVYKTRAEVENTGDAGFLRVQGGKDISHDRHTQFSSFFGHGKRSAEAGAFKQAHMTPSGTPGVLNLAVVDHAGASIPFAPFNWNGH